MRSYAEDAIAVLVAAIYVSAIAYALAVLAFG